MAVRHPHVGEPDRRIRVVSPCGMCRELIGDYGPEAHVIFAAGGEIQKCRVGDLLPAKYARGDGR